MEYHDNSEPAYRDYGQIANNEGAYIPMEDVDAALRRIDEAVHDLVGLAFPDLLYIVHRERERLGLPKEIKV